MNLVKKQYLGKEIEFKMIGSEVYANATSFGEMQKLKDWKRSKKTIELIDELKASGNIPLAKLIIVEGVNQHDNRATWIHEDLVLDFAQYINVKFRV